MTIRELRKLTSLTQKAFSEKYHIPKRTLEDWEGGRRKPTDAFLYLLERVVMEDYSMKYVVIDDCTTKRASIFDETFQTEQEALQYAESEWSRLTDHDKNDRDAFYVATCSLGEDGEVDWDSIDPIKEYK